MASHAAGDTDVYVDAVDELRRALPDEDDDDDEFHDALESRPHREDDSMTAKATEGCEAESPMPGACEDVERLEKESEELEETSEAERRRQREAEAEAEAARLEERQREEAELPEAELERRFEEGQQLKAEGNAEFRGGEYDAAIERYGAALEVCPLRQKKERAIMFANRAACFVKKVSSCCCLFCGSRLRTERRSLSAGRLGSCPCRLFRISGPASHLLQVRCATGGGARKAGEVGRGARGLSNRFGTRPQLWPGPSEMHGKLGVLC